MSLEQLLASIPPGSPDETLARQVNFEQLPAHVAIIMDGNGRWAAQRHLPRVEGHRAGIDSVRDVVETSARLGIEVLTLYAFSVENWKRPRTESQHADDAAQAVPAPRAQHAAQEQHPVPRHRPHGRAVARRAARARIGGEARPRSNTRDAVQHRAELRRPRRDRRRGAARDRGRHRRRTISTSGASASSSTRPASPIPIC